MRYNKKSSMAKTKKQKPEDLLKQYLKADSALLERSGLKRTIGIAFPSKKRTPLLGKIATKMLTWSGGQALIRIEIK